MAVPLPGSELVEAVTDPVKVVVAGTAVVRILFAHMSGDVSSDGRFAVPAACRQSLMDNLGEAEHVAVVPVAQTEHRGKDFVPTDHWPTTTGRSSGSGYPGHRATRSAGERWSSAPALRRFPSAESAAA